MYTICIFTRCILYSVHEMYNVHEMYTIHEMYIVCCTRCILYFIVAMTADSKTNLFLQIQYPAYDLINFDLVWCFDKCVDND